MTIWWHAPDHHPDRCPVCGPADRGRNQRCVNQIPSKNYVKIGDPAARPKPPLGAATPTTLAIKVPANPIVTWLRTAGGSRSGPPRLAGVGSTSGSTDRSRALHGASTRTRSVRLGVQDGVDRPADCTSTAGPTVRSVSEPTEVRPPAGNAC
jgi:hypothetical protein